MKLESALVGLKMAGGGAYSVDPMGTPACDFPVSRSVMTTEAPMITPPRMIELRVPSSSRTSNSLMSATGNDAVVVCP